MIMPPRANEPPDWDAIARHRAGEAVGDEARRLAAWLEANPLDARMLAALDDAVGDALPSGADASSPDVESALRSVRARMREATSARVLTFPTRTPGRRPRRWLVGGVLAAAAVGALAVGLGRTRDPRGQDSPARGAAGSVITTAMGRRDSVRLPDGTRVILAPASRLAVSPSFGVTSREVSVEGMVWLAVRHDPASPFTVRAGGAIVRDVGTAFVVRTTRGAPDAVSVVVSEGSVELRRAVTGAVPGVTLTAGDRGALTADGRVIAERGAASEGDVAWTRGRLVFRDAPLDTVRAELRYWYGVDLEVADSTLAVRRLTAIFDGDPVDRVLEVIALALGARVERNGSLARLRTGTMR